MEASGNPGRGGAGWKPRSCKNEGGEGRHQPDGPDGTRFLSMPEVQAASIIGNQRLAVDLTFFFKHKSGPDTAHSPFNCPINKSGNREVEIGIL